MSKQFDNTDRGALFKNDKKSHENQPDYTGTLNVSGVEFYLSAWLKTSESGRKYMSLAVTEKEKPQPKPRDKFAAAKAGAATDQYDDGPPF
jgi:uncharacterized protein (DUF736 family)